MGSRTVKFDYIHKVKFLRIYDVFLDLVILVYFNTISIDLYAIALKVNLYPAFFLCNFHADNRMHIKILYFRNLKICVNVFI